MPILIFKPSRMCFHQGDNAQTARYTPVQLSDEDDSRFSPAGLASSSTYDRPASSTGGIIPVSTSARDVELARFDGINNNGSSASYPSPSSSTTSSKKKKAKKNINKNNNYNSDPSKSKISADIGGVVAKKSTSVNIESSSGKKGMTLKKVTKQSR